MTSKIRLAISHGADVGKSFDIALNKRLIVGRGASSDTKMSDPALSRVHFSIEYMNGRILLSDLGSLTGTFVNGVRVDRNTEVDSGDEIMAGDSKILIAMVGHMESDTIEPTHHSLLAELNGLIGTWIGGFLLKRVIGVGKTGLVFEAFEPERNRTAAVKVFSQEFTQDKKHRERFVQGTRSFAKIQNANLIRLYKAGKTVTHYYVAMELVEGENLHSLIHRHGIEGMLDWQEAWKCAFQIASALTVTHEKNVIHRNLIPRNIIRRFKDQAFMLGDFTLAAPVDPVWHRLRERDIIGHLHYLPPERLPDAADQMHGLSESFCVSSPADIRSDIFGLGATCYALLTGKPPATGLEMGDVIDSIRTQTPNLPSTVHLAVNDQFQSAVMKMIAKNPADRFQTPQDLLKELFRIGRLSGISA